MYFAILRPCHTYTNALSVLILDAGKYSDKFQYTERFQRSIRGVALLDIEMLDWHIVEFQCMLGVMLSQLL